jgi:hypothetical protein
VQYFLPFWWLYGWMARLAVVDVERQSLVLLLFFSVLCQQAKIHHI